MRACNIPNKPAILQDTQDWCLIAGLLGFAVAVFLGLKLMERPCRRPHHPLHGPLLPIYAFGVAAICYFILEALVHTTFGRLPNTCAAMIDLAGSERAEYSYPCQRDRISAWYSKAINTGHLNLTGLLGVKWVQFATFWLTIVLFYWLLYLVLNGHLKFKNRRRLRLEEDLNEGRLDEKSFRGDQVSTLEDGSLV